MIWIQGGLGYIEFANTGAFGAPRGRVFSHAHSVFASIERLAHEEVRESPRERRVVRMIHGTPLHSWKGADWEPMEGAQNR